MLMNGANDSTKKDFLHALNYEGMNLSDINNYNHQFLSFSVDSSSANKMFIANSLWINDCKKVKPRKSYIDLMSRSYQSAVQTRDFCKDFALVENEMSKWIAEHTNGFLSYSPKVRAEDAMVSINTVYFKGLWDDVPTTPIQQPFTNRDGSKTECMYLKHSEKSMPYVSNRYFRAVKLFYKNADYSMIVVLPEMNKENTETKMLSDAISEQTQEMKYKELPSSDYQLKLTPVAEQFSIAKKLQKNRELNFCPDYRLPFENELDNSLLYESAFGERTYARNINDFFDVDTVLSHIEWEKMEFRNITFDEVRVPHFETENCIDLKPIVADMGVPSIFNPVANSLNKIADSLYISNYIQKAKIIVNEMGTEAAAAVAVNWVILGCADSKRKPITFIADRPFIYAIYDERTSTILFVGRVVDLRK